MRILISLLFVLCLFVGSAFGQNSPKVTTIQVKIALSCEDKNIAAETQSYLARELRSLGDVEVSDNTTEWVLNIVVTEGKLESGRSLGYVIGYAYVNENIHVYSSVAITPLGELQDACKKIVAFFDSDYLNTHRKILRNLGYKPKTAFFLSPQEAVLLEALKDEHNKTDVVVSVIARCLNEISPNKFTKLIYLLVDRNEKEIREYLIKKRNEKK